MVRHPADYPWSSYCCNANGEPSTLITPHDCWLKPEDDDERTAAYRELINERMSQAGLDQVRQSLDTGLPTANDRFRREIEQALAIKPGNGQRGRPGNSPE